MSLQKGPSPTRLSASRSAMLDDCFSLFPNQRIVYCALVPFLVILLLFGCQRQDFKVGTVDSADGVAISYSVGGQGKPALVFVHGWSCDRSYWDVQLRHFSEQHKVVAVDLAGHGDSGLSREAWTIPAFAEDVLAVIDDLGLQQMVLIGHSMGGPIVVEVARRIPARVIGIIGVDTFQNVEELPPQEAVDQFLAPLRQDFVEGTRQFVRQYLFSPTSDSVVVEKILADMASAPPEVGLAVLEGAWKHDLRPALAELNAPIRCINSDMYPVNIEAARRYVPSFEVAVMKGIGHFPMNEDPNTFNRLLTEAVDELCRLQGEE
jgi:pimeloyl-ACP methyl ester carboxylesterase